MTQGTPSKIRSRRGTNAQRPIPADTITSQSPRESEVERNCFFNRLPADAIPLPKTGEPNMGDDVRKVPSTPASRGDRGEAALNQPCGIEIVDGDGRNVRHFSSLKEAGFFLDSNGLIDKSAWI